MKTLQRCVGGAGDPPLAAVEHVVVAVALDAAAAMLVASELATSGSVMANAERISPSSSGCSHCSCCSGVPNIVSISMFPVSGAEQLQRLGGERASGP